MELAYAHADRRPYNEARGVPLCTIFAFLIQVGTFLKLLTKAKANLGFLRVSFFFIFAQ